MIINRMTVRRGVTLAGVLAGGLSLVGPAFAGKCPADMMRPDGSGQAKSSALAKDVTDSVLGAVDLEKEPAAIKDRMLRLRRLEIKPGGVVPWHEHANRPAIIYIIQGEIVEYASTCAVPITHRAGDTAVETHATSHWWKNNGNQMVVLLSADFFPVAAGNHHMM
ncbi:MAG: cupin domain-containing protein [Acetobacteraceae bacterium]